MIITSSKAPLSAFGPARKVIEMMQKDFQFDISDRMIAIPEVDKFRINEDESIQAQVKSEKYEYEVYFDGEFVCFFSVSEHPQRVRINILNGLKDLIKNNKIFWNPKKYDELEEEEKQRKRDRKHRLETIAKQFTTSEEKLVVSAIEKHVK